MRIKKKTIQLSVIVAFYILLAGAFVVGISDGQVITQAQLNNLEISKITKGYLECQRDAPDSKITLHGIKIYLVDASCLDLYNNGDGTYNITRVNTDVWFRVSDYKDCINNRFSHKNWTDIKIKERCDGYFQSVLRGGIDAHVYHVRNKVSGWQTGDYDMDGFDVGDL